MRRIFQLLLCLLAGQPGFAQGQPLRDAAGSVEARVIVTAPAHFEQRAKTTFLVVADTRHRFEIPWAGSWKKNGMAALEAGGVYSFTVIEATAGIFASLPAVVRVERDGRTIYDRDVPINITAPALSVTHDGGRWLLVADASLSFELPWGFVPEDKGLGALEVDRVYTFSIIEEPVGDNHDFLQAAIVRVAREGKVIYDREICEVHHVKMERKLAPVEHGFFGEGPNGGPSWDTERLQFPHWREYVWGGAAVGAGHPTTERVYVCSRCKEAFETWSKGTNAPPLHFQIIR